MDGTATLGSLSVKRAGEIAWETAMARYWSPSATEQQLRWQRKRSDGDVHRALHAVGGLGLLTVTDGAIALTVLGRPCLRARLGLRTSTSHALRVRVTLQGSADPVIWRRLRVPADIRLDRFHRALAAAIGWRDCHLHVFERGGDRFGYPDPDLDIQDERAITLTELRVNEGDRLDHEYDFGDAWRHAIVLEEIAPGDPDDPRCVGGAGRCSPEDVGGIHGYERLRGIFADPRDDQHAEMLAWFGPRACLRVRSRGVRSRARKRGNRRGAGRSRPVARAHRRAGRARPDTAPAISPTGAPVGEAWKPARHGLVSIATEKCRWIAIEECRSTSVTA